jgi:hypothetical protein
MLHLCYMRKIKNILLVDIFDIFPLLHFFFRYFSFRYSSLRYFSFRYYSLRRFSFRHFLRFSPSVLFHSIFFLSTKLRHTVFFTAFSRVIQVCLFSRTTDNFLKTWTFKKHDHFSKVIPSRSLFPSTKVFVYIFEILFFAMYSMSLQLQVFYRMFCLCSFS